MKKLFVFLILTALFLCSCFSASRDSQNSAATNRTNQAKSSKTVKNSEATDKKSADEGGKTADKTPAYDCLNIKIPDRKIDKKQTFPIDFNQFRQACFVTTRDPEYDDPPLDSEFFIYKDGKQIYKFPNQFNGVTTGCWVEGVAFQDLNDDGLTDIIIAGMCSAKTAPYSENMVYVNNGKEFTTNEEANYTLEKFKKIKDIADFVKRNKEQFFQ